jgi:nucleoside-triphosphatase THEP1
MKIGYVRIAERGELNRLLAAFAEELTADGVALAGAVQHDIECAPQEKCDMDLQILPTGPVVRISQNLGRDSRGCRLDTVALEQAVGITEAQLSDASPKLVIINKFGKHEADGRGFRSTIALALEKEVPVLVGVNGANITALEEFTGGAVVDAGTTLDELRNWLNS